MCSGYVLTIPLVQSQLLSIRSSLFVEKAHQTKVAKLTATLNQKENKRESTFKIQKKHLPKDQKIERRYFPVEEKNLYVMQGENISINYLQVKQNLKVQTKVIPVLVNQVHPSFKTNFRFSSDFLQSKELDFYFFSAASEKFQMYVLLKS